jgi:hypothetical protein
MTYYYIRILFLTNKQINVFPSIRIGGIEVKHLLSNQKDVGSDPLTGSFSRLELPGILR